ncbi:20405_t:CDS:1, partial [Gigaspora rosea]
MYSKGSTSNSTNINQVFSLIDFSLADFFQEESASCRYPCGAKELLCINGHPCGTKEVFVCSNSCSTKEFSICGDLNSAEKSFVNSNLHNVEKSFMLDPDTKKSLFYSDFCETNHAIVHDHSAAHNYSVFTNILLSTKILLFMNHSVVYNHFVYDKNSVAHDHFVVHNNSIGHDHSYDLDQFVVYNLNQQTLNNFFQETKN